MIKVWNFSIDTEYFGSTFFKQLVLHVLRLKPKVQAVLLWLTVGATSLTRDGNQISATDSVKNLQPR